MAIKSTSSERRSELVTDRQGPFGTKEERSPIGRALSRAPSGTEEEMRTRDHLFTTGSANVTNREAGKARAEPCGGQNVERLCVLRRPANPRFGAAVHTGDARADQTLRVTGTTLERAA